VFLTDIQKVNRESWFWPGEWTVSLSNRFGTRLDEVLDINSRVVTGSNIL